ncbi:MAG: hypothetical protein WA892_01175 [Ornithinimicrobium sp.]
MSTPALDEMPDPAPGQEHLSTGWEPDVPAEDTLLRRYLLHWAAYCDGYALAGGGETHRTDAFAAADLRRPSGYFNSVTLLRPPGDDLTEVLDEVDDFAAGGRGELLMWSPWLIPQTSLSARGWQLYGHPPLLARPPATLVPAPTAPALDIRRASTTEQLVHWEQVAVEGYPMPELAGAAPGAVADPSLLTDSRFGFWVGYEKDRAVSLGTSFVDYGIGSFALGVTRPEARRRGHWLAHAVARLRHSPDVWMTGVFSDFSRPGAESIGFVPLLRLSLWALPRP